MHTNVTVQARRTQVIRDVSGSRCVMWNKLGLPPRNIGHDVVLKVHYCRTFMQLPAHFKFRPYLRYHGHHLGYPTILPSSDTIGSILGSQSVVDNLICQRHSTGAISGPSFKWWEIPQNAVVMCIQDLHGWIAFSSCHNQTGSQSNHERMSLL